MTAKRRQRGAWALSALLGLALLAACGGGSSATSTAPPMSDATAAPSPTRAAASTSTATTATTATSTSAPPTATTPATATTPSTATSLPATATAAGTAPASGAPHYLDDRSNAAEVIRSFYNAINRHEYLRAYSYWEPNVAADQLPPYDEFAQGYGDTASVDLALGTISAEAGAGQRYYAVPVVLRATMTDGAEQTFAGCYGLHLSEPHIQAAPPYQPLAIEKANIEQVDNGSADAELLASACEGQELQPLGTPQVGPPDSIEASVYLDDRSTAVQVLRSLYNAVNSQEYARAYAYWEAGAPDLPSFDDFQAGYAATASVELTTGTFDTGAAAGNLYFSVPVTLVARTTDGAMQTFVGCYQLHLGQPAIQATPPFQPLAIQKGTLQQVDNDADTASLMSQACQA